MAAFNDPEMIVGWAIFVAAVTLVLAGLLGRPLARRSRILAFLVCGALVPAITLGLALVQIATAPNPPPNHAPVLLFAMLLELVILALPVSLLVSALLLLRPRPAS